MSEGRRAEEEKSWQKTLRMGLKLVPILCIVAVIVFFVMLFDMKNKVDEKKNTTNNTSISNKVNNTTNNVVNNTVNNVVNNITNDVQNTQVEQNTNNNQDTSNNQNNQPPVISRPEDEPDIKQAKEIFNEFWGEDSNSNIDVYKDSNGEYVVRVTSNQTGSNKYFKVNISSKDVTEY